MKVKIIYRNYRKLHTIHSSIIDNPPSEIDFFVSKPKMYLKPFYPIYNSFKKNFIFKFLFGLLRSYVFSTNGVENYDLIHYVQYIPGSLPKKPYVVDFEHVVGFTDFLKNDFFFKNKVLPFLKNKDCKKIIAISKVAEETLKKKCGYVFKEISDKVCVVYPALPINFREIKIKKNTKMIFLFVGNQFYRKGLYELLEAFVKISSSKAELIVISDAPDDLKKKFCKSNIIFLEQNYTHKEIINNFFFKTDVFVMPTHSDTFGMVYLDALSCGVPVIATDQFAIPEIVIDGINGFLVHTENQFLLKNPYFGGNDLKKEITGTEKKLVKELVKKINFCIDNPKIIQKMSRNTKRDFTGPNGKFSIEKRNSLLKKIYEKSLEIL